MVVREPMNYSSEITKSLVPEHLKSLGYNELKGFSAVRVPWLAKNHQLDNNFEGDPVNDAKDFLLDKFLLEE